MGSHMPPPIATSRQSTDTSHLQDALFSADIDLEAEEALLSRVDDDGRRHQTGVQFYGGGGFRATDTASDYVPPPPFLDANLLAKVVRRAIGRYDAEALQLLSQAAREYMLNLLSTAIILARHRRASSNQSSEVTTALRQLAQQEREGEEQRRARKAAAAEAEAQPKARHMSDEAVAKNANATALHLAGGRTYSWMKSGPVRASRSGESAIPATSTRKGWKEEDGVTLRDMLLALEGSRGLGMDRAYAKLRD